MQCPALSRPCLSSLVRFGRPVPFSRFSDHSAERAQHRIIRHARVETEQDTASYRSLLLVVFDGRQGSDNGTGTLD